MICGGKEHTGIAGMMTVKPQIQSDRSQATDESMRLVHIAHIVNHIPYIAHLKKNLLCNYMSYIPWFGFDLPFARFRIYLL